jgi:hypothetical protein
MPTDNVSIDLEEASFSAEDIESTLPPVGGLKVLGVLDRHAISDFVHYQNLEADVVAISDALRSRLLHRQADALVNLSENPQEVFTKVASMSLFTTESEAEYAFRKLAELDEARIVFWNRVRTQYNSWNSWLEIRLGWKVCYDGKKFERPIHERA